MDEQKLIGVTGVSCCTQCGHPLNSGTLAALPVDQLPYEAVFILVLGESDNVHLAGTAFAISPRHVMTAFHLVYDAVDEPTHKVLHVRQFASLSQRAEKFEGVIKFDSLRELEFVTGDFKKNWAVYRLIDPNDTFTHYFPLCPSVRLPTVGTRDLVMWHAPVRFFNNPRISHVNLWKEIGSVVQYCPESSWVLLLGGPYGFLYGAPLLNPDGQVFGMHVSNLADGRPSGEWKDVHQVQIQLVATAADIVRTRARVNAAVLTARTGGLLPYGAEGAGLACACLVLSEVPEIVDFIHATATLL